MKTLKNRPALGGAGKGRLRRFSSMGLGQAMQAWRRIGQPDRGRAVSGFARCCCRVPAGALRKRPSFPPSPVPETFPLSILAIRTPKGIGVGSTEEEINRAYGKIVKKELAPYIDEDSKDAKYRIHVDNPDKKLGMIFTVQYGRVLRFSLGMLNAINRMEGCS